MHEQHLADYRLGVPQTTAACCCCCFHSAGPGDESPVSHEQRDASETRLQHLGEDPSQHGRLSGRLRRKMLSSFTEMQRFLISVIRLRGLIITAFNGCFSHFAANIKTSGFVHLDATFSSNHNKILSR